jgi:hypothetical protein
MNFGEHPVKSDEGESIRKSIWNCRSPIDRDETSVPSGSFQHSPLLSGGLSRIPVAICVDGIITADMAYILTAPNSRFHPREPLPGNKITAE